MSYSLGQAPQPQTDAERAADRRGNIGENLRFALYFGWPLGLVALGVGGLVYFTARKVRKR